MKKGDFLIELVQNYYQKVWEEGLPEELIGLVTVDYERHLSPDVPPIGVEAQIRRIQGIRSAFPDMHIVLQDYACNGNLIFARTTTYATHLGDFRGIRATGKKVCNGAMEEFLVEDGKIKKHWGGPDTEDILRQLGGGN